MTNTFNIGDRVRIVDDFHETYLGVKPGYIGTVVDILQSHYEPPYLGVRMDKYNSRLHTCEGKCSRGHGIWLRPHSVEMVPIEYDGDQQQIEPVSDIEVFFSQV